MIDKYLLIVLIVIIILGVLYWLKFDTYGVKNQKEHFIFGWFTGKTDDSKTEFESAAVVSDDVNAKYAQLEKEVLAQLDNINNTYATQAQIKMQQMKQRDDRVTLSNAVVQTKQEIDENLYNMQRSMEESISTNTLVFDDVVIKKDDDNNFLVSAQDSAAKFEVPKFEISGNNSGLSIENDKGFTSFKVNVEDEGATDYLQLGVNDSVRILKGTEIMGERDQFNIVGGENRAARVKMSAHGPNDMWRGVIQADSPGVGPIDAKTGKRDYEKPYPLFVQPQGGQVHLGKTLYDQKVNDETLEGRGMVVIDDKTQHIETQGPLRFAKNDPGPMVEKQYGPSPGDRYGMGQFERGTTRLYASGRDSFNPATIRLSFAKKDGGFDDAMTVFTDGTTVMNGRLSVQKGDGNWNWVHVRGNHNDNVYLGSDGHNRGIWADGPRDFSIYNQGRRGVTVNQGGKVFTDNGVVAQNFGDGSQDQVVTQGGDWHNARLRVSSYGPGAAWRTRIQADGPGWAEGNKRVWDQPQPVYLNPKGGEVHIGKTVGDWKHGGTEMDGRGMMLVNPSDKTVHVDGDIRVNGNPVVRADYEMFSKANKPAASGGSWYMEESLAWDPIMRGNTASRAGWVATHAENDADTSASWIDYDVPTGMKQAYIVHLPWVNCRYFDVYGGKGKDYIFIKRVNAFIDWGTLRTLDNSKWSWEAPSGHHSGVSVVGIAGVNRFDRIRIQGRKGRIHLMGIGWTREEGRSMETGFVHWDNVTNKPIHQHSSGQFELNNALIVDGGAWSATRAGKHPSYFRGEVVVENGENRGLTHFNHLNKGDNYITGTTHLRNGEVLVHNGKHGVTHFNHLNQGLNYIRGPTTVTGTLNVETGDGSWNWIRVRGNNHPANVENGGNLYFGSDANNRGIWADGPRDFSIYNQGNRGLTVNQGGHVIAHNHLCIDDVCLDKNDLRRMKSDKYRIAFFGGGNIYKRLDYSYLVERFGVEKWWYFKFNNTLFRAKFATFDGNSVIKGTHVQFTTDVTNWRDATYVGPADNGQYAQGALPVNDHNHDFNRSAITIEIFPEMSALLT